MKIKFILPALQEAKSPYWRPIKYSLFPPLGLATLASLCSDCDTRHLVFKHPTISKEQMEIGYNKAYKQFYQWNNIISASKEHDKLKMQFKHFAYSSAWKKFEPLWNFIIKHKLFGEARKILEQTLN